MQQRRRLARALLAAAAGTACLALATPAWATGPDDPSGANGTVKINELELEETPSTDPRNIPHVTCTFQVKFFNFDENEKANLVFYAWKPSGPAVEVLRLDDRVVSKDPANNPGDVDEVFPFTVDDLNLDGFFQHDKQGYHVKLTVERQGRPAGTTKHKVFWLKPCGGNGSSPPPSYPASSSPAPPPGAGGSLPITGVAGWGLALAGVALVGAGTALMVARHRRKITFIS